MVKSSSYSHLGLDVAGAAIGSHFHGVEALLQCGHAILAGIIAFAGIDFMVGFIVQPDAYAGGGAPVGPGERAANGISDDILECDMAGIIA